MTYTLSDHQFDRRDRTALLALLAIGAVVRVLLAIVYQHPHDGWMPDTTTYMDLAERLAALDLTQHDGDRTPGFPQLLVLAGLNPRLTLLLQALLGLGASALLYLTAREISPNRTLSFIVALSPTVVLNQLFMETNLLSEHLTTVLAIATLYVGVRFVIRGTTRGSATWLGLLAAATALARPVYLGLFPVYLLVVILFATPGRRVASTSAFLAAAFVPILGWMTVNAITIGQFGMSLRLGLGLMNHAAPFIEHADDRYATIRDILLRHREAVAQTEEARVLRKGEVFNTIHYAKTDLMAATGKNLPELSRELNRLAIHLFLKRPDLYAKSVIKAWLSYWTAPNYWYPDSIHGEATRNSLLRLWQVQHPLVRLTNVILVVGVAFLALTLSVRAYHGDSIFGRPDRADLSLLLVGGTVLFFSLFQALFEYGENGRYGIPTQSFAIAFVILLAHRLLHPLKPASHWGGS